MLRRPRPRTVPALVTAAACGAALVTFVGVSLTEADPTAAAPDGPTCHGEPATIVGTPENDRLVGTPARDVIIGLGGSDRITGMGGDDLVCGGDGADRLDGGDGDDRLYGGRGKYKEIPGEPGEMSIAGDELVGGAGDDVLVPGLDRRNRGGPTSDLLDYSAAPQGLEADLAAGTVTGDGRDRVRGTAITLLGSAYDDDLRGSGSDENIYGGLGSDLVHGRGGADRVVGTSFGDLPASGDTDVLHGGGGPDDLHLDGTGRVLGGAGDDTLYANGDGDHAQLLYGGAGNDSMSGWLRTRPGQVFDGGPGRNTLELLVSAEERAAFFDARAFIDLASGQGRVPDLDLTFVVRGVRELITYVPLLTFSGTAGPDLVANYADTRAFIGYGRGGNDNFSGTETADVIDGGPGHDTAHGSDGRDTCRSIEDATSCERR